MVAAEGAAAGELEVEVREDEPPPLHAQEAEVAGRPHLEPEEQQQPDEEEVDRHPSDDQ